MRAGLFGVMLILGANAKYVSIGTGTVPKIGTGTEHYWIRFCLY